MKRSTRRVIEKRVIAPLLFPFVLLPMLLGPVVIFLLWLINVVGELVNLAGRMFAEVARWGQALAKVPGRARKRYGIGRDFVEGFVDIVIRNPEMKAMAAEILTAHDGHLKRHRGTLWRAAIYVTTAFSLVLNLLVFRIFGSFRRLAESVVEGIRKRIV